MRSATSNGCFPCPLWGWRRKDNASTYAERVARRSPCRPGLPAWHNGLYGGQKRLSARRMHEGLDGDRQEGRAAGNLLDDVLWQRHPKRLIRGRLKTVVLVETVARRHARLTAGPRRIRSKPEGTTGPGPSRTIHPMVQKPLNYKGFRPVGCRIWRAPRGPDWCFCAPIRRVRRPARAIHDRARSARNRHVAEWSETPCA